MHFDFELLNADDLLVLGNMSIDLKEELLEIHIKGKDVNEHKFVSRAIVTEGSIHIKDSIAVYQSDDFAIICDASYYLKLKEFYEKIKEWSCQV